MTVATSDALEQVIILGQGAARISTRGLRDEIETAKAEMRKVYMNKEGSCGHYLLSALPKEEQAMMEAVRLGHHKMEEKNN